MLLSHFSRSEYTVTYSCVETAEDLLQALYREKWDIIISDYCLPDFTGSEALSLLQQQQIDLPFIIVSGNIGEEVAVEAMKAGAHDYIFKGNLNRLLPAVSRELGEAKRREEYRQAQQALNKMEARYHHLVEHIPAAVYWTDTEHPLSIQYISPQAIELFGFDPDALLQDSMSFYSMVHHDDREYVHQMITESIAHHRPYRLEYRLLCEDETVIWVLDSADIVSASADASSLIQGILIDITQQKAIESEIRQHEAQLRALTIELSAAEERERRRMATALHDQISQTLAFAKIELRTFMANPKLPHASERLERLFSYIDIAYQQTKTLTFELSPPILYNLGFAAALDWLVEQYQTRHDLNITVSIDGSVPQLKQDIAIVLFRAVQELLTNIVKHANAHLVHISLTYCDTSLKICVADDGIGYSQATLSTSQEKKPYTFGLFNLRERMDYLGGSVNFTSSQNQGTEVMIKVPIISASEELGGVP